MEAREKSGKKEREMMMLGSEKRAAKSSEKIKSGLQEEAGKPRTGELKKMEGGGRAAKE